MYPYLDSYQDSILDLIGGFLNKVRGGGKATLESIKDPYGISDMDDPVVPAFVQQPKTEITPEEPSQTEVGEYQYPRVEVETPRMKETDRMVDLILNLPETKAEAAAKVDYEALARENFRRNNPALESMPDEEEFLYNRYKRNLASKLAKKEVTVKEAEDNPEQAFLAKTLERYLAEEPDTRRGRQRGF